MTNKSDNTAFKRIEQLLDEHSFVELGALVTSRSTDFDLKQQDTPSDGVVIGHGLIDGNLVFVYSQDASVLNGTIGEMHAKKILSVYDMAMKMGAPIIGLLDSAGVRLQESVDALESLGAVYAKAVSASGVIPQIVGVFGTCGGGLSVLSSVSDFTMMTKDAKLFVNSPDAIPGNRQEVLDTAGADFQYHTAGNVDFVGDEADVCDAIRQLVCILPGCNVEEGCVEECMDDLNRAAEGLVGKVKDIASLATELSDSHVFVPVKGGYAGEMQTGFIKLGGITVGVVGNSEMAGEDTFDAVLTADGCEKAADFISFCDAFDIPLLTVTNVTGYEISIAAEQRLTRALGKMTYAFANATVPKISLMVGQAMGSAYVLMNSKSLGADLVYAFADATVAPMDASLAAQIMYADESADVIAQKAAAYAEENCGVNNAARRGYIDRIVEPVDARKYLIAGFEMLFTKRVDGPYKKHGTK
ncbi:MAG: carboxyl transferase domain-containing protein [Lachnospiraceae bacterium]|nr:carboxyl transferase domain-containing protein [Lachnospiraceae bacterium]